MALCDISASARKDSSTLPPSTQSQQLDSQISENRKHFYTVNLNDPLKTRSRFFLHLVHMAGPGKTGMGAGHEALF